MEFWINSPEEIDALIPHLLQQAEERRKWLFYGDIGAGKTTFVQAFCRYFSIQDAVTSPTFSLVNEYRFQKEQGETEVLYHLDLYRLKTIEEALDIGIEEYLYDDSYCLIEWPQLIENLLPEAIVRINIEIIEHSKRKLVFLLD